METHVKFRLRADRVMLLMIFLGLMILPFVEPGTDYASLVYKKCGNETFSDGQTLASLFNELVSRSLQSKFFRTTAGAEHGGMRISGLYRCRGDMTNQDCHVCVSKLPNISNTLCNKATSARIHLSGCSLRYRLAKDHSTLRSIKHEEAERHEKVCSEETVEEGVEGFDEMRESVFEEMKREVVAVAERGYCSVEREGFEGEAECEEGMEERECEECVRRAVEFVKEECERAVEGEVLLEQCSVSYAYLGGGRGEGGGESGRGGEGEGGEERGVGGEGDGFPYPGDHGGEEEEYDHSGHQTAIILGGVAVAMLIGLVFMVLIGFARRKDDC